MTQYILTIPVLVFVVATLFGLGATFTSGAAAQPKPALACAPDADSQIPSEYLYYHALVSPHAPLIITRSERAACPAVKGVRT